MGKDLKHCHSSGYGGHFNGQHIDAKVLQSGLYWPSLFKECNLYAKSCDQCQRTRNIGKINEMPSTSILEVELFDVWGIDFIRPFPSFCGYKYIFLAIDYVSK